MTPFSLVPDECLQFRRRLDDGTISPHSIEQTHLGDCPACQDYERQRATWDLRLAVAMKQVVVPLPASLACAESLRTTVLAEARLPVTQRGRRTLRSRVFMACLLLILVGGAWWWRQPTPWQLEELVQNWSPPPVNESATESTAPAVEQIAAAESLSLPDGWQDVAAFAVLRSASVPIQSRAKSVLTTQTQFRVNLPRARRQVMGWLIGLPSRAVQESGQLSPSFLAAPVHYRGDVVWCAWREGETTFICYIPTGPQDLDRIREKLQPTRTSA